jgi:hypothetical protein
MIILATLLSAIHPGHAGDPPGAATVEVFVQMRPSHLDRVPPLDAEQALLQSYCQAGRVLPPPTGVPLES